MADLVLPPRRMNALLLGVAAVYFVRQPGALGILCQRRKRLWMRMEALTVVSAALLVPSAAPGSSPTLLMQVVGYDCLDVLYVCLLLACLADEKLEREPETKWLMSLGAIAYGVYLPNVPVSDCRDLDSRACWATGSGEAAGDAGAHGAV